MTPRVEPAPRTLALIALAGVVTSLALYAFFAFPGRSDFRVFYLEGVAWRTGASLYQVRPFPNLNPPTLTITVFAALSWLPYRVAQIAWVALNAVSLIAALGAIRRELALPGLRLADVTALLLITHGAMIATVQGQVTWMLLYPITRAWIAYRRNSPLAAGAWLAPAIAAKPPLALLALVLPWRVWLTAGAASAGASLAAITVTGIDAWRAWIAVGSTETSWLPHPANASLWGAAARLQAHGQVWSVRISDLPRLSIAFVLAIALVFYWHARRQTDPDRRFLFAVFWSLLAMPLGWRHYFPWAVGPAVATWPRGILPWTGYALTLIPIFGFDTYPWWLGPVYFLAVLLAWIAWTRSATGVRE